MYSAELLCYTNRTDLNYLDVTLSIATDKYMDSFLQLLTVRLYDMKITHATHLEH